jgi:hypothetical protein
MLGEMIQLESILADGGCRMKKLLAIGLVFLFVGTAFAQTADKEEMKRRMMERRIRQAEEMLKVLRTEYVKRYSKKEEKAADATSGELKLEPGEVLFMLRDGSKLKGKLKVGEFKVKTAYGTLTVPVKDARRITFVVSVRSGGGEKTLDKEMVATVEFTAKGTVELEKFELKTGRGTLTIQKADIKQIFFAPPPAEEKEFKLKPTGEWLNTGIKLKKGDKLKITAEGELEWDKKAKFRPDGTATGGKQTLFDPDFGGMLKDMGFSLVAKIGEKGSEFKAGASCDKDVDQKGTLYLKIKATQAAEKIAKELKGSYKVKVITKTVEKPTEAQEKEAAAALEKARAFDKANPYEGKEKVAAKYKQVTDKYPGTKAAKEAADRARVIMQRRK